MRTLPSLLLVLCAGLLCTSCSTIVPATITRPLAIALDEEAAVFLVAARQREAVKRSLVNAGIRVIESGIAPYTLRVKIGSSRGSRECGSKNNVVYSLSAYGRTVLGMKGRGWTGSCPDSMLDDMSTLLAEQFTSSRK